VIVPNWYALALLAAAAWRVWHLLAHDSILDWPRRRVLRLDPDWRSDAKPGQPGYDPGNDYRLKWALFLTCFYCAGFWIGAAWWAAFEITQHWTLVAAVPFAISALVVAAGKTLTQDE
jgi:hypothetical protein